MKWFDFVLFVIAVLVVFAVKAILKQRRRGGCVGLLAVGIARAV